MRQVQRSGPGISQYQSFAYCRMPVINAVYDGDLKRKCLALKMNGERFSICQSALVRSQQLKSRAGPGQSFAAAGKRKSRGGPLLSQDEMVVRRETGEPRRKQPGCGIEGNPSFNLCITDSPGLPKSTRSKTP